METIKFSYQIERKDISYLSWIIQSYDGIAVLKTIDPYKAIIELQISPGCEDIVFELLDALKEQEEIISIPD
ncbi:MAG: hypothetical protein A2Z47_11420 [Thermodesulfovibrio sp. RBG_19FT_COMBO_42_12]|nr:MAG: hypothetical protein A2Z47_11420 [Thermodesulfovibrio sp. RBG_19FT_COMBO_42_12]